MVEHYNTELARYQTDGASTDPKNFVDLDSGKFSWDRSDFARISRGVMHEYRPEASRGSTYRPFQKQHVHFDRTLNNTVYRLNELFPTATQTNHGFYNVGSGSAVPFSVLMTDALPDLHVTGAGSGGQFFARYSYAAPTEGALFEEPERRDNITDWALDQYREAYGPQVSKDEIFFYVYGLLHSPEYRTRYAADLKKQLPRIPMVPGRKRFDAFATAGRELSELHIGYENLTPYEGLEVTVKPGAAQDEYERYAVTKMKYAGKAGNWDKTQIVYNPFITISNIPEQAQEYMLGSRSGLDWILERYQIKTDKASGIVNDPNDWSREHEQPRYILDLIGRIVTLSLETNRTVNGLPDLSL